MVNIETNKKIVLVILFPITLITFSICNGFFLDSLVGSVIEKTASMDLGISGLFTIVTGVAYFLLMHGLLKCYNKIDENKKTLKWKLDKYLIFTYVVEFISAIVLLTKQFGDRSKIFLIIGYAIFPLMGIIATLNIVRHTLKGMKDWEKRFYEKDDLNTMGDTTVFYKVNSPLSCERKIYFRVLRNQLLELTTVVLVMILIVIYCVHTLDSVTYDHILNADYSKRIAALKLTFIFMVFLFTVAIPIIAYCITGMTYELKVIRNHEYIAYHAVVKIADGSAITIEKDGRLFSYKDYLCIGINAKKINNTNGTLVFIPDNVLFIPDEQGKS